jgi:lipopolysaccharide transport system permease protein
MESVGIDSGAPRTAAVKPETDSAALPLTIIEPTKGWAPLNIREVWRAHELLDFLVWRDVKVRYKPSAVPRKRWTTSRAQVERFCSSVTT